MKQFLRCFYCEVIALVMYAVFICVFVSSAVQANETTDITPTGLISLVEYHDKQADAKVWQHIQDTLYGTFDLPVYINPSTDDPHIQHGYLEAVKKLRAQGFIVNFTRTVFVDLRTRSTKQVPVDDSEYLKDENFELGLMIDVKRDGAKHD